MEAFKIKVAGEFWIQKFDINKKFVKSEDFIKEFENYVYLHKGKTLTTEVLVKIKQVLKDDKKGNIEISGCDKFFEEIWTKHQKKS